MTQIRTRRLSNACGFTMLEAIVAIFVTLIVMASVFGLLVGGARTSNVEFDRADLQAQTRHALTQMSRDVMLAGYGLPPEFPSFGTGTSTIATDRLSGPVEIFGMTGQGSYTDPIAVERFDGKIAHLGDVAPTLAVGQPVVVYDDLPVGGSWILGLVSAVYGGPLNQVELVTGPGESVSTANGDVSLPSDLAPYNRIPNGPPISGYLTPVDIVTYELEDTTSGSMPTLVRQLNWGERVHVAHIESMEIRYFVGGTLVAPVIEVTPRAGPGLRTFGAGDGASSKQNGPSNASRAAASEVALPVPPTPQPNPEVPIGENNVVRAVRISLTGRSREANLVGSELDPDSSDTDAFVRQTFSTRVATRNLLSRAELRLLQLMSEDAEAGVARR